MLKLWVRKQMTRRDTVPTVNLPGYPRTSKVIRETAERMSETEAKLERVEKSLESLCVWLLHRFGPDSPEGQESSIRLKALRKEPQ